MKTNRPFHHRPRNKSNMDQPQEEFIEPSGTHVETEPKTPAEVIRGSGRRTTQNSLRSP
jgi:hypothetical protein